MKYIRTTDGIKKVHKINNGYLECDSVIGNNVHCYAMIHKNDVIKQGDTIEELCDEFVLKGTDIDSNKSSYTTLDYCPNKNQLMIHPKHKIEVFGAIWTDKGLIYVAKMNEKGELELL